MKRYLLICFAFSLLSALPAKGQTVSNPVDDFLSEMYYDSTDTLFRLEVDVNNDGLKDVLLTLTRSRLDPAEEEYGWTLYIRSADGYVKAGRMEAGGYISPNAGIGFRKDLYFVGYIPEIGGYGLLTLSERSAKCKGPCNRLKAIKITGPDSFQEILFPPVEDTEVFLLKQRFGTMLRPAVESLSVSPP